MQKIINLVDNFKTEMLKAESYIWQNAETGYKEEKTSTYMESKFKELGYNIKKADGITGFYTELDTGRKGPTLLILAELDSVICKNHKDANKDTGAVHSCGHNAQCSAILGVVSALKEKGALDALSGKIRLCLVPAEELLEIEYRQNLIKQGVIKYALGKTEFLYKGYFDGVDLAFMIHTSNKNFVNEGAVGSITKKIIYKGKSAHAGGAPWQGVNALYASTCGLNAINSIRETFSEPELIRVHPIITSGGDMVNAIPEKVTIESYVRGSSFEAMIDANKKVNRALIGGALSLGANVEIIDSPGYAPLKNDEQMVKVCLEAFESVFKGEELHVESGMETASTDLGDLSLIMPVVHPYVSGAVGTRHGDDYEILDKNTAVIKSAKWQLAMVYLLLSNGAKKAIEIVKNYKPKFKNAQEYLDFIDKLNTSGNSITYTENGANIKF